jgi:hypothetical protein
MQKPQRGDTAGSLGLMDMNKFTLQPGLVVRAVDSKWSSASWYLLEPARQQDRGSRLFMDYRWARSIEVERTSHWRSQWHPAMKSGALVLNEQRHIIVRGTVASVGKGG